MVQMAEITLILGSAAVFVVGFAAWYPIWHRRMGSSFERVPVRARRSVRARCEDVDVDERTH